MLNYYKYPNVLCFVLITWNTTAICLIFATNFYCVCVLVGCRSRPTATECLAHRWMQKKKPKKMVRKSSSKKLIKQMTEEKTKPAAVETMLCDHDELLPLDASKENLKELCNKSCSQSPMDIVVQQTSPSLAQLRMQKDSKSAKTKAEQQKTTAESAVKTIQLSENDDGPPAAATCDGPQSISNKAQSTFTGGGPQVNFDATLGKQQPQTISKEQQTTIGKPHLQMNSGNQDGSRVTSGPVDVPTREVSWSQATMQHMLNNNYRRSSDVSYMFSSFRTATTTMQSSSKFLGADLRGLSDRLQDLQAAFDDRERPEMSGVGSSLHKLLLNRQQLTAAVADRRPKFRLSAMNRDVPIGSPPPASNLMYYMTTSSSSSCRSAPHSKRASPEHETTSACREMLLKLFYGGGSDSGTSGPGNENTVPEPELSA